MKTHNNNIQLLYKNLDPGCWFEKRDIVKAKCRNATLISGIRKLFLSYWYANERAMLM